jgi:DNA-3-methyladenine glycosylase II
VQTNRYQRLLSVDDRLTLATVSDRGTITKPQLQVELQGNRKVDLDRPEFVAQLRHILCTDLDLKPFYRQVRTDDLLAPVAPRFRGLKLPASPTVFESLVMAVLSQQVNLTFAYSIKKELVETFGKKSSVNDETYYAFPTPERFAEEKEENLLRFRLSRAKAGTLVRLGQAFTSGVLKEEELAQLPDEEVVERLIQVKGIGVWTAQMFLMFSLGRLDVFPHDDLGIKMALKRLYGLSDLPDRETSHRIAEPWRPYATIASWYCWRSHDVETIALPGRSKSPT